MGRGDAEDWGWWALLALDVKGVKVKTLEERNCEMFKESEREVWSGFRRERGSEEQASLTPALLPEN